MKGGSRGRKGLCRERGTASRLARESGNSIRRRLSLLRNIEASCLAGLAQIAVGPTSSGIIVRSVVSARRTGCLPGFLASDLDVSQPQRHSSRGDSMKKLNKVAMLFASAALTRPCTRARARARAHARGKSEPVWVIISRSLYPTLQYTDTEKGHDRSCEWVSSELKVRNKSHPCA